MGSSVISLGLGLGGGKASTSSGGLPGGSYENLKSVLFDGTDDYADSGATFNDTWSGSFTISLWYKSPSSFVAGVDNYLGNTTAAGKGLIEFRHRQKSSTTAQIELYFSESYSASSGAKYNTYGTAIGSGDYLGVNTWYHLCWVVSRPAEGSTSSTLYIDGTSVTLTTQSQFLASVSNAGGTFDSNTLIARRNDGTYPLYLDGHLDEMAFFDSALSSGDVTAIYNSGEPASLSGPSHWWRMGDGTEEGSGTTVYDMAGSTNLTLTTDPGTDPPTYSTDVPT